MPTYAQRADLTAWLLDSGLAAPDDDAAADRLLERAERDIDGLLGNFAPLELSGLKLDPTQLESWEAAALNRAVCAQAEWRMVATETALAGVTAAAPLKSVEGPDFKKTFAVQDQPVTQRRYGPKVRAELEPIGHLRQLTARAMP